MIQEYNRDFCSTYLSLQRILFSCETIHLSSRTNLFHKVHHQTWQLKYMNVAKIMKSFHSRDFAVSFLAFNSFSHLIGRLSAPGYVTSLGILFPKFHNVPPSFSNLATAVTWDPSPQFKATLGFGRSLISLFIYLPTFSIAYQICCTVHLIQQTRIPKGDESSRSYIQRNNVVQDTMSQMNEFRYQTITLSFPSSPSMPYTNYFTSPSYILED